MRIRHILKWNLEWKLGAEIKPDKPEILLLTQKVSIAYLWNLYEIYEDLHGFTWT